MTSGAAVWAQYNPGEPIAPPAPDMPRYAPAPVYAPAPPVMAPVAVQYLSEAQLDQLTAPIALYPDPLIAQILPASTYPLEIVTAAQWLRSYPQPTEDAINVQAWEPSIKALVHYPTVLQMMADRIQWTQSLGSAFQVQPADVMSSIQRMRLAAQAAGNLVNTPQQVVVVESGAVRILPVQPEVLYVPVYDPAVVYVRHREPIHNAVTFSAALHIGGWLNLDVDWHNHYVAAGVRWESAPVRHDHDVVVVEPRHVAPVVVEPAHPWVRNPGKPVLLPPPRPASPEHRGWAAPAAPPRVFGGNEPRQNVEQERDRGRQSMEHQGR
jgi:hypothetical protein